MMTSLISIFLPKQELHTLVVKCITSTSPWMPGKSRSHS